jgi:thioredoxin-dependent peroxiredoxin
MNTDLKVGDPAPPFEALALGGQYGSGQTVRLADFAGQHLVLYFYPKDDTPGCTAQACGLRDRWPDYQNVDAAVFGVSIDSLESHQKFIDRYGLPFPLLSDEEGRIVRAYGVWVEKEREGKKLMGTERSTFVVGPDGRIKEIFRRVSPEAHADMLLEALQK